MVAAPAPALPLELVRACYRVLLGRQPESEDVVRAYGEAEGAPSLTPGAGAAAFAG